MNDSVTKHSLEKMKERKGIKAKKAARQLSNAIQRGKTYLDFSSMERQYLENKEKADCRAIAYDGFCFILNENNSCVTLYPLPKWFGRKKHFVGKTAIRNYRKYLLMYN